MLNNYRKVPREENWQSIQAKIKAGNEELIVKNKFDDFSQIPNSSNWNSIQAKIDQPTSTSYRKIHRIAAAIAMLILFFSVGNDNSFTKLSDVTAIVQLNEDIDFQVCQHPRIVALDIVTPVLKSTRKSNNLNYKKASKQKRLLDIILAKDDNIESAVDSALIAELLRPVEILPEESMFANLGGSYYFYRQGDEFKKMYALPEIEYLLEMPNDSTGIFLFQKLK